MKRSTIHAPARCVLRDDGELGCSTRRWEERLTVSQRLYREVRRNGDLAGLFRGLAEAHTRKLPRDVRVGYELGTRVHSRELGVELVAVSTCRSTPPGWAPVSQRQLRRPDRGCRLYTYFGFGEEM
jgi:hypothetical protein